MAASAGATAATDAREAVDEATAGERVLNGRRNYGIRSSSPNEGEIIAFFRGRTAGYKLPRKVVFLNIPKTSTLENSGRTRAAPS